MASVMTVRYLNTSNKTDSSVSLALLFILQEEEEAQKEQEKKSYMSKLLENARDKVLLGIATVCSCGTAYPLFDSTLK